MPRSTSQHPRAILPTPSTPLIGRAADLAAVRATLLQTDVRLLTLSGAPGIGKTRLAIQTAVEVRDTFTDGVAFVALAPVRDASLVVSSIAQALDVRETGKQPLIDTLMRYLHTKQQLLVLDNFEHLVAAAPLVGMLLEHAPGLTVLVTSRVVLHLVGEHEYVVPPLALPDLQQLPTHDRLARYAAVELFVQRTQAVRPDFALMEVNAPVVAAICARLDGLPLAIELAAARVKLLPPPALLRRLDHRLALLTGGAVDADARHQTLRSMIDWSYDLLNAHEQALFRRLGVFVGGCSLDTAEAVCAETNEGQRAADHLSPDRQPHAVTLLDELVALVDHSLLQHTVDANGEPRVTMLETIRDYALEQLAACGEAAALQQRHAAYYLALAEAAEPELKGPLDPEQAQALLDRLPLDHVPDVAALPPGSRMPLRPNPLFVGREADLLALAAVLKGTPSSPRPRTGEGLGVRVSAVISTGIGGVGKTQLAVEVAHRYGQFFAGGVFWLSFADPAGIDGEIAACSGAGALELYSDVDGLSQAEQVAKVVAAWQQPIPRLLIIDNCDDLLGRGGSRTAPPAEQQLANRLPRSGGCRSARLCLSAD